MKTGLTIQQMAQELLRQSKAKQDYLVNTGSLSLSVTSDAPQLRVTENGLDKIAPLDIRQTAHRQLGTYLGIPQKYYELMRTDAPELLAYNANYWFSQKNELRTLRTMDGCARAFLSNRYRRIDNLDIASVTLPVIGELPEARFVSTQITDDFMYIKVVNPRLQADVVPGDVVQAGVIISNSETGLGSVTIQPLIYRLVCSNGMVINDAKTRRNHVGRAATSEEDFSIYSNETLLADDHAFVLKIKDTVRAAISEARFAQVVSRMRESKRWLSMSKITEKIAKLLALAESPYEEEAKAALLQARRLMAEHKLMPEDIEPQENKKVIQECVGITCTKLSSPWTVYLSTLIAAHYCCRPYRSSVHGSKVSEIGFIGMEDDFKLCKLAFLYAYDCIASRCRQIRTQKGYPAKTLREMCNSYGWGFCRGLSAAFQKQEAEHQEWGLVMVVPQAVEDAVSKMKRSSYKISSTSSMNRQYAAMGYADGQEFDMRRRLEPSA